MQSGGEEEPEDEPHPPLPPRMEIIKDPSAPDDKVTIECFLCLCLFSLSNLLFFVMYDMCIYHTKFCF